jgi:hypothetical protein
MSRIELVKDIISQRVSQNGSGDELAKKFSMLLNVLEKRAPAADVPAQRPSLLGAGLNALADGIRSKANDSSRPASNPFMEGVGSSPAARPLELACAGSPPPPGTAVVGVFTPDVLDGDAARARFVEAAAASPTGMLDTMIIRFMDNKKYPNFGQFAEYLAEGVLSKGGTIAMPDDATIHPDEFQNAADRTGATIVIQGVGRVRGITIYEKDKDPVHEPNGGISDGGIGMRGACGSEAGVYRR